MPQTMFTQIQIEFLTAHSTLKSVILVAKKEHTSSGVQLKDVPIYDIVTLIWRPKIQHICILMLSLRQMSNVPLSTSKYYLVYILVIMPDTHISK